MKPIKKVVAYITREQAGQRQLLVNLSQDALNLGVQVPTGIVASDESVHEALYRKIKEEAGLLASQIQLERQLAEYEYPLQTDGKVQKRIVFHLKAVGELPDQWVQEEMGNQQGQSVAVDYFWLNLDQEAKLAVEGGEYLNQVR